MEKGSNTLTILVSIVAVTISLFALFFSWQQTRDVHNQLLLSLKPSINFMTAEDADDPPVGISIQNAGPGPALIKSVTWYVNKKPFKNADDAMKLDDFPNVHALELEPGDTLGVGETDWLVRYGKKPHGAKEENELNDYIDELDNTAVEIEFCPVMGTDCGKKCSTQGWCSGN